MLSIGYTDDPSSLGLSQHVGARRSKGSLYFLAVLFFGPASVALMLGLFFLPSMLLNLAISSSESQSLDYEFARQILMVIGGVLGWIGIARVIKVISDSVVDAPFRNTTRILVVIGVSSLFSYSYDGGISLPADFVWLTVYGLLPTIGIVFFTWLARDFLLWKTSKD